MSKVEHSAVFSDPMKVMREVRRFAKWWDDEKREVAIPQWYLKSFMKHPLHVTDDEYQTGLAKLAVWSLAHPEPRYPTFREWVGRVWEIEEKDTGALTRRGSGWTLTVTRLGAWYETPYEKKHYGLDEIMPEYIAKLLRVGKITPEGGSHD